jgi:hypothetical protein
LYVGLKKKRKKRKKKKLPNKILRSLFEKQNK